MDNFGGKLEQMRKSCGLNVEEVAELTNIRSHVIIALEKGEDPMLPAPYVKSFIKSLEKFYQEQKGNPQKTEQSKSEAKAASTSKTRTKAKNTKNDEPVNDNSIASNIQGKSIGNMAQDVEIIEFNDYTDIPEHLEMPDAGYRHEEDLNNKEIFNDNDSSFEAKTEFAKGEAKQKDEIVTEIQPIVKKRVKEIKPKKKITQKAKNIIIYTALGLFFATVIYLVFFSNKSNIEDKIYTENEASSDTSVLVVKDEGNLFSYFAAPDSLKLIAMCKDTAWVKVEIDGESNDELMMVPGMKKQWSAFEYILLSTSKIGNIAFYKNDTLIPNLGAKGAMVKNIKITREGIANVHPLENQRQAVSTNEINPHFQIIQPSRPDSSESKTTPRRSNKKKKTEPQPLPILDFSTPAVTKPPILNNNENQE